DHRRRGELQRIPVGGEVTVDARKQLWRRLGEAPITNHERTVTLRRAQATHRPTQRPTPRFEAALLEDDRIVEGHHAALVIHMSRRLREPRRLLERSTHSNPGIHPGAAP